MKNVKAPIISTMKSLGRNLKIDVNGSIHWNYRTAEKTYRYILIYLCRYIFVLYVFISYNILHIIYNKYIIHFLYVTFTYIYTYIKFHSENSCI
jgi:hypothetical protein